MSRADMTAHRLNLMTPVTPDVRQFIDATWDHIKERLDYLSARWSDEKEYEDIEEYQASLEAHLPEGVTISRMTQRPFGFKTQIGNHIYHFFAGSRNMGWKRVGAR